MTTPPDPRAARETAAAALARAAACEYPGPWSAGLGPDPDYQYLSIETVEDGGYPICGLDLARPRTAAFIAASITDVPQLAALVTALADEVERLRAEGTHGG